MKKFTVILGMMMIAATSVFAANHSGTISANEIWTLSNNPHHITGQLTISDGVTVTIEPGCQVYFDGSFRILVYGALVANGTSANHILFTSSQAVPDKGDWRRIYFNEADAGTILNYCDISYGGSVNAAVEITGSTNNITISNCTITNSAGYGIFLQNNAANPSISNCAINDCDDYPIFTRSDRVKDITGTMSFTGNTPNAIWVNTGNITTGQWLNHGVPYILGGGNFTVPDGNSLTIDAGVTLKFDGNRGITINGDLKAIGTSTEPITFTSNAAVPARGDWRNLYFNNVDNACNLSGCILEYGGSANGTIYTNNNTSLWLAIHFSEISNSGSYGIYNTNTSYASIGVVDIHDCDNYPIRTGAGSVGYMSAFSTFTSNTPNAIRVEQQTFGGVATWLDHGIPYVIWNDITINDATTLTLQAGAELKFNTGARFQVDGTLIADGDPVNHITFTSNQALPAPGNWERLFLNAANAGTILDYCDISYGGATNGNIDINNCSSNVSISNSTITYSSNDGVYIRNGSSPSFINSVITSNNSEGIYITGASSVTFGSNPGEWNEIYGNGSYELRNGNQNTTAEYVYWGTTYCGDIPGEIYDDADLASLGVVDYTPWLDMGHGLPSFTTTWTGAAGTLWNTSANWDSNVPCSMIDVVIPKAPANQPIVISNEKCNDLTMEAGSKLTVFSGSNLNVAGDLFMEANVNGTASLVESGGFTVAGSKTVQYFIDANRWHYVTPPLSGQTANTFLDMYLYDWSEGTDLWNNISDETTPLTVGKGYKVWSSTSTPLPDPPGTTSVEFIGGTLNTGNKTLPVTKVGNGWNFVGNPYPSAVDWDNIGWIKSNIDATIYVWDGVQYISWNGSVGDLTGGVIPAMQGFMVKATATSPLLVVSNSTRLHGVDPYKESSVDNLLEITISGNGYSDKSFINFNDKATNGFDSEFDGYKIYGLEEAPQLYTIQDENKLRVNVLPASTSELFIPMGLEVANETEYTIVVNGLSSFNEGVDVYLEDVKEKIMVDLSQQIDYSFVASPVDDPNRFVLHFGVLASVDQPAVSTEETPVTIYSNEHSIYLRNNGDNQMDGEFIVYNIMGQRILSQKVSDLTFDKIDLYVNEPGYFIVKFSTDSGVYSQKVFIK